MGQIRWLLLRICIVIFSGEDWPYNIIGSISVTFWLYLCDSHSTHLSNINKLCIISSTVELRNRHLLHTTYRLYMYAIVLQVVSIVLLCVHYARYGVDGQGYPNCKLAGQWYCLLRSDYRRIIYKNTNI